MKRLAAALALMFFISPLPASAQTPSRKLAPEQLAKSLAEAYEAKD